MCAPSLPSGSAPCRIRWRCRIPARSGAPPRSGPWRLRRRLWRERGRERVRCLAQLEIAPGAVKRVVAALDRHRHVDISELVFDRFRQRIGEIHHLCRILRLDKMLGAKIAVAQMQAELDVVGHRGAEAPDALEQLLARHVRRHRVARLAVPDHHLVADVPLDAKIAVRDMPAQCGNFGDHGFFIRGLDRRQHGGDDDRTHHRKRRRQTDLKTDALRQHALVARRDKVEIRGARLAGIAELAETHVRRRNPFAKREQRKAVGRADGAGGIRPQIGARAQQRILPADPQAASADLAVGNAAQIRPEQLADGGKNLIHRVEADAADQMNVHCAARFRICRHSAASRGGGRI